VSATLILLAFALEADWTAFAVVLLGGLGLTALLMLWPRDGSH
jgi:hypothetical protein